MWSRIALSLVLMALVEGVTWAGGGELTLHLDPIATSWEEEGSVDCYEWPAQFEVYDTGLFFDFQPRNYYWAQVQDIGNSVLWGPEQVMNGVAGGVSVLLFSDGVAGMLLDGLNRMTEDGEAFTRFMEKLNERETRYLAGLESEGEIETHEMWNRQLSMVWQALGDALFDRFRRAGGLRAATEIDRWQTSDFIVGSVLMVGAGYLGGASGEWNFGSAHGRLELAPVRQIQEQWSKEDFSAALAIEAGLNRSPILLVVTVGIYDGDPEVDFVGIGTGIGEVRELLRERA